MASAVQDKDQLQFRAQSLMWSSQFLLMLLDLRVARPREHERHHAGRDGMAFKLSLSQ